LPEAEPVQCTSEGYALPFLIGSLRVIMAEHSSYASKILTKVVTFPAVVDLIYNAFDWIGMDIDESPRHGGDFGPVCSI
jgi:hypothetical protein